MRTAVSGWGVDQELFDAIKRTGAGTLKDVGILPTLKVTELVYLQRRGGTMETFDARVTAIKKKQTDKTSPLTNILADVTVVKV